MKNFDIVLVSDITGRSPQEVYSKGVFKTGDIVYSKGEKLLVSTDIEVVLTRMIKGKIHNFLFDIITSKDGSRFKVRGIKTLDSSEFLNYYRVRDVGTIKREHDTGQSGYSLYVKVGKD